MLQEYTDYIEYLKKDKSPNTIKVYSTSIELFLNYFKIESVDDVEKITPKNIRKYQEYLVSTGLSNSSVNSRMRPVSAFLNHLVDNEDISRNVLSNVKAMKEAKRLPDYLTEEEISALFDACENDSELVMLNVLLYLGVRREELVNIKVSDIEPDGHINIIGKGNKERRLLMPDDLHNIIKEYLKTYDGLYLITAQGENRKNVKMSTSAVALRLKSLAKRAGLPKKRIEEIHVHLCRHTTATTLLKEGVDINVIQKILGHESSRTTMIYAHVVDKLVDDAMKNRKIG